MYKNVSKIGLSGRKYLKDLTKTLKSVEKFQFKNGVKGMMDMAKWAQNTRFNMNSLDSILQSFSENGLEGAITKAAGMQVLGGNFAMGADPLAMLWERYNDPHAFAQRQNDMVKGLGKFNNQTGEVEFNMMEQIQLEQFAKYAGQSVEDLMNQQRQRIKGEQISNSLNNGVNWSDEEKALVTNKAQLRNGQWQVTMADGQSLNVSDLSRRDLNYLMPETNDEKLVNYVFDIRNMMTKLAGEEQGAKASLENDTYKVWYQEELTRMQNVHSEFYRNYEEYLKNTTDNMKFATASQKTILDMMGMHNENIDTASSQIIQEGQNIASSLAQVDTLIQTALDEIDRRRNEHAPQKGEIAYEHSKPTTRGLPFDPRFSLTWKNPLGDSKDPEMQKIIDKIENGNISDIINTHNGRRDMHDGTIEANGNPIAVSASKITPINDGQIAMTDPKDHALFAKVGGPFDTLFNGIFAKINEISNVLPKGLPYEFPEKPIKEIHKPQYNQQNNFGNVSNSPIKIEPITLNINLNGLLGKSKDFMEEITNNPMLLRSLSQLISESINKNINGGKSTYTGGIPTPRFRNDGY